MNDRRKRTRLVFLNWMLLATGSAELVEDSTSDSFWDIGDGSGTNWLGRLLMELREKPRSSPESTRHKRSYDKPVELGGAKNQALKSLGGTRDEQLPDNKTI